MRGIETSHRPVEFANLQCAFVLYFKECLTVTIDCGMEPTQPPFHLFNCSITETTAVVTVVSALFRCNRHAFT